ncbi:MAG: hypothetical protein WBD67_00015 [Terracidiphilus sp.]
MIANPDTSEEVHINAELTKDNASLAKAVHECDLYYRDWAAATNYSIPKNEDPIDDWSRKVEVTMTGPRFVSMVATDDWFCGGVHPDWDRTVLLFDLATGRIAEWSNLIKKTAGWSLYSESTAVGSVAEGIILPELKVLSIENAVMDCKDVYNASQAYLLWPDAKKGVLVAWPWGVPHAGQACAENIALTTAQARAMGFSEVFLQAIEQAHKQYLTSHAKSELNQSRRPFPTSPPR